VMLMFENKTRTNKSVSKLLKSYLDVIWNDIEGGRKTFVPLVVLVALSAITLKWFYLMFFTALTFGVVYLKVFGKRKELNERIEDSIKEKEYLENKREIMMRKIDYGNPDVSEKEEYEKTKREIKEINERIRKDRDLKYKIEKKLSK